MRNLNSLASFSLSAAQLDVVDGGINNIGDVGTKGRKATIDIKDFSHNSGVNLTQLQEFLAGLGG